MWLNLAYSSGNELLQREKNVPFTNTSLRHAFSNKISWGKGQKKNTTTFTLLFFHINHDIHTIVV